MSATTDNAALAVADKFAGIRNFQEREGGLIGRRTEMQVIQIAITAKLHPLLYGTPGVAKSMTVNAILKHLDGVSKFQTQAYKASPPEQFLGPVSIKGMAEDQFIRIVRDRLPAVEIGFIDEIMRAPRALLPAFQSMMVEREFDSGYGLERVPLMSLIGTCNHIPDDPELEAFLDRFALKLVVKPPISQTQFNEIMRSIVRRRDQGEPEIPDELKVSHAELGVFQRYIETVHVADEIFEAFGELWANVLGLGLNPSPRRFGDLTKAMQAMAALDGRDAVTLDDLQIAQHSLWDKPDRVADVYREVVKFASEWMKVKAELLEVVAESIEHLGQLQALVAGGASSKEQVTIDSDEQSILDHGLKVVSAQRKARKLIETHIGAATGQDISELESALAQIDSNAEWVSDKLLGGLRI